MKLHNVNFLVSFLIKITSGVVTPQGMFVQRARVKTTKQKLYKLYVRLFLPKIIRCFKRKFSKIKDEANSLKMTRLINFEF